MLGGIALLLAIFARLALGISAVDPRIEGLYSLQVKCEEENSRQTDCTKFEKLQFKLAILSHRRGVNITVSAAYSGTQVYSFKTRKITDGVEIEADSFDSENSRMAELFLRADLATASISGWISDLEFDQRIGFTGVADFSQGSFYNDVGPPEQLSLKDLEGTLSGEAGTLKGELKLSLGHFGSSPALLGVFLSASDLHISFTESDFNPVRGILTLTSIDNVIFLPVVKWVLAYRKQADGNATWRGFAVSRVLGTLRALNFE